VRTGRSNIDPTGWPYPLVHFRFPARRSRKKATA
jgi:hypothetical protein